MVCNGLWTVWICLEIGGLVLGEKKQGSLGQSSALPAVELATNKASCQVSAEMQKSLMVSLRIPIIYNTIAVEDLNFVSGYPHDGNKLVVLTAQHLNGSQQLAPGRRQIWEDSRNLVSKTKGKAVGIKSLGELFDIVGKSGHTSGLAPFGARIFGFSRRAQPRLYPEFEHSPGCTRSSSTSVKGWGIPEICAA